MIKNLLILVGLTVMPMVMTAQTVSLDECQKMARANYPLIKKYDLIDKTTGYTVDNLQKGWLPQISASAQATLQSKVMTLPGALENILKTQGIETKGLRKDQYKVGVDVSQNIWDGGRIRKEKEVARAQGEVEQAQNDVNLYGVAERINDLCFGILLTDAKLQMNKDMQTLLQSNLEKLQAMLKGGTAMQCDVNSMKVEKLKAEQQEVELRATHKNLTRVLSIFCGMKSIGDVQKPSEINVGTTNNRPELKLIDSQLKLADRQEKLPQSNLMPKFGLFASGYYGYPGYDMFHDMFHHNWTLNGMVGAKVTWNIGALYTNKNDKAKIQLQRDQSENAREVFLFNNSLEQIDRQENISKYRSLMTEDEHIVDLCRSVRLSAESKLKHGIIDVNNLLQEINRENSAKDNLSIHEIEMLKQMYDLKYTVNP